jgi:NADPH:quinone reductase-like Zn-dependent oxidoreductase
MKPAGPDRLELGTAERLRSAQAQVQVRLHANSLNDHDSLVVAGVLPAPRRSHSDG